MNNMKEVGKMEKVKEALIKIEEALEGKGGGKVVLAKEADWKEQRRLFDKLSQVLHEHPNFLFSKWGQEEVALWFLEKDGRVVVVSYRIILEKMVWVEIGRIADWQMEYFIRDIEKLQEDVLPIGTIKANQEKIKEVVQTWKACKTS